MFDNDIFSNNFNFDSFQANAIKELKSGKPLVGKEGVLAPIIKKIIEASLEGELSSHLLEETSKGLNNKRNGKITKTVKTGQGAIQIDSPRDRNSTFEPELIKKRQTVLNESLDNKILDLFAAGVSYKEISAHLADIYGLEVSSAKISQITDKLIPVMEEWRNRPLNSVYPIVYLDAIHYKVRESGHVQPKAIYTVLGLNVEGKKEVLGLYLSESEGAKFWLSVLVDLKNRGVEDILICCIDGLKGFPEAISSIYPRTEIQLCVIHQIRNTLRYVVSKDQRQFMSDLKLVYRANSKDEAESNLEKLDETWGKKYSIAVKSWYNNWDKLSEYFKFPEDLRRIIYTTNTVEGLHRQMRKYTKNKGSFTSSTALLKILYCACSKASNKWTQPMHNWALILSQLNIYFDGRLKILS